VWWWKDMVKLKTERQFKLTSIVRVKATLHVDLNSWQMCHFKLPLWEQVHINKVQYRNASNQIPEGLISKAFNFSMVLFWRLSGKKRLVSVLCNWRELSIVLITQEVKTIFTFNLETNIILTAFSSQTILYLVNDTYPNICFYFSQY
jgi:hypothetical protein